MLLAPPPHLLHSRRVRPAPAPRTPACRCSALAPATSFRLSRCSFKEVEAVAALVAAAFVETSSSVPRGDAYSPEGYVEFQRKAFFEAGARELRTSLRLSLSRKSDAEKTCRAFALQRRAASLRAGAARLQSAGGGGIDGAETLEQAAALAAASLPGMPAAEAARLRRARQYACLTLQASDASIVGVANLSWFTPSAALPPPFPTSASHQLYLSNMAVSPELRRRGLAGALLARALRIGRAWGAEELQLHVDESNAPAQALYLNAGWTVIGRDEWWVPPSQRRLLLSRPCAAPLSRLK